MGIGVLDLASGERTSVDGDDLFPMASTFKVPVLYALMQQVDAGLVDLDEALDVRTWPALGSGVLKYLTSLSHVSVRDLAHLMITVSDNLATDLIMHRIGGPAAVTQAMLDLGLDRIRLTMDCLTLLCTPLGLDPTEESVRSLIAADPDFWNKHQAEQDPALFQQVVTSNVATPNHMCELICEILIPTSLSPAGATEMIAIMSRQNLKQRIPAMLPESVSTINKTGTVAGIRCDVGAMWLPKGPVAFSAFILDTPKDMGWEGDRAIAEAARLVSDYYS